MRISTLVMLMLPLSVVCQQMSPDAAQELLNALDSTINATHWAYIKSFDPNITAGRLYTSNTLANVVDSAHEARTYALGARPAVVKILDASKNGGSVDQESKSTVCLGIRGSNSNIDRFESQLNHVDPSDSPDTDPWKTLRLYVPEARSAISRANAASATLCPVPAPGKT